jgi:hypothetical protein
MFPPWFLKLPVVTVFGLSGSYRHPLTFVFPPLLLQKIFTHQSQNYPQRCDYQEKHQREEHVAHNVTDDARRQVNSQIGCSTYPGDERRSGEKGAGAPKDD